MLKYNKLFQALGIKTTKIEKFRIEFRKTKLLIKNVWTEIVFYKQRSGLHFHYIN